MEIVVFKSLAGKLNLNIVCGQDDSRLFFSGSDVMSFSTALNAIKGTLDGLKGLAVLITQADSAFLRSIDVREIKENLEHIASSELIIIHEDSPIIKDVLEVAARRKTRVCTHSKPDNEVAYDLSIYIEGKLNSVQIVHGVLMDVFGVGVMLVGESGTGKSETALELIARGQRLVADDAVALRREGNSLIGCSPALTRHFMDIRGIGIIDVRAMYGAGAIRVEQELELVIKLEPFNDFKDYRMQDVFALNGVSVPMITLPLKTANMAILTEVAARNFKLNAMGQNASEELKQRIKNRQIKEHS